MTYPLHLNDIQAIQQSKHALEHLYAKNKNLYIDLFFHEEDVAIKDDVTSLLLTGILKRVKNKYRANVQVFSLSGKFICTDFLFSIHRIKNNRFVRRIDDVWPILPYESPYLAKKAIVQQGDYVLDLATGSGIIAIFCADKAKKVIATDINPRAIHYAKFNAILNNVENKIEFRGGDSFAPLKREKFDLIIWNGPTLAVPKTDGKYPIYCDGGEDGLRFTRTFIQDAPKHLTPKGRMQWLDPSLGTKEIPESLNMLTTAWKNKKFKIIYQRRVKPTNYWATLDFLDKKMYTPTKNLPARPLWTKPVTEKEIRTWTDNLRRKQYTHIHAGMYMVYPAKTFSVQTTELKRKVFKAMNRLPKEYHQLSHTTIKTQLRICENYEKIE